MAAGICLLLYCKGVSDIWALSPLRVDGFREPPETLLEKLENYDFQGVWRGGASGQPPFPHFTESFGRASLKLFLSRSEFGRGVPQNVTLESDRTFVFHLRMEDGNSTAKTHEHRFRVPFVRSADQPFHFSRRMTIHAGQSLVHCTYSHRLWLDRVRFDATRELQDLEIGIELSSEDPHCQTSVTVRVHFDEEKSNKSILQFLMGVFCLGAFEAAVILAVAGFLRAFEYNFRFQSVIFWSFNASMSCLNCFVLISLSSDHPFLLGRFLLAATLNFTNFSLVVLYILTPHTRFVGFAARFSALNADGETRQLKAQSCFVSQAILAVIGGMACGYFRFPTVFFMTLLAACFGIQCLRIAFLNERFYVSPFPGMALCLAKLLYCVR